ncbi:FadR/GntR family transcriptional regulator [Pseudonocardia sp. GCM10023141]|uniref:FadR/GntR family transcriptional regulator n=1 Tax=Pseudonocardia sp. GCM10023141 TaxID=3252653 RepID=UPI00360B0261
MLGIEQSLRTLVTEGAQQGTWGPGSTLPTERALVEQLAAPRSAIRRALESLERDGLVIRHVGRGTFLTDAVLTQGEAAPADTGPAEIMQVRLLLEPQVATLASRVANQADLDRIGECLAAGGGSTDFEGLHLRRWAVGRLPRSLETSSGDDPPQAVTLPAADETPGEWCPWRCVRVIERLLRWYRYRLWSGHCSD